MILRPFSASSQVRLQAFGSTDRKFAEVACHARNGCPRQGAKAKNLYRPLTEADDLGEILAWREERMVTRNLTLRYDRMMLLLDPTPCARELAGKQEGGGSELPGRAVRGPVQRNGARFQGIRQDPDSAARCDHRQQTAIGCAGAGKGSAGRLPGASATRACCAAATAEQPRGAGSAVEGPGTTSHDRGCSGLRQPLPDLADADVVLTAVKTASRAPSAVALASLGPVLTAIARDAPTTLRSGRRNDVSIEQRNCNLQLGKSRGGTRLAISLVGSASNGGVISTLRVR